MSYDKFANKNGKVFRLLYQNSNWLSEEPRMVTFNGNSLIYIPNPNWDVTSGNDSDISSSNVTPYYPTNFINKAISS